MLPIIIYYVYLVGRFEVEYITIHIFLFYLCCLAVLHYWWMYIFLKMLNDLIYKGKTEDQQNVAHEDKIEETKKEDLVSVFV